MIGVHLRTIFRWIEGGFLHSQDGKVRLSEAQAILHNLNRSCTKLEVRRKLGICCATLRSWKDRGILEFIVVVGCERVLKSSVERIQETKNGRRVNFHPDFVPVYDLLKVTGLECSVLNDYIKSRVVKSKLVSGKRMIPRDEFEHWSEMMKSTLRPTDVARILDKHKETIQLWRKTGRLREVDVLGRKRIAIDSIAQTPKEKQQLESFLNKNRKSNERKKETKPKPIRVRDLGALKVFTCKQAADLLGQPLRCIEEMFRKGILRGRIVGENIYIIASSLEAYSKKSRA